MPKYAFAVPVLPGKDARDVPALFQGRMEEYAESRRRNGITMERVYLMPTPMGEFAIAYLEAERDFGSMMQSLATSDLAIDREFQAKLTEVHGMDASGPAAAPPPEVLGDWEDPEVHERRRGLAFVAPLMPGRTDAARAFTREAWVTRREAMTASRRELGENRETVVLNTTPMGDVVCVYLEGTDPVEANRRFAESQSEFDTWFKQQLSTIFPPDVDFSQPLPPIEQIWDWQRTRVSA